MGKRQRMKNSPFNRRNNGAGRFKSAVPNQQLVTYVPRNTLNPFPQRYRTRFYVESAWAVPIAVAATFDGIVGFNDLTHPFNSAFSALTYLGPATAATLEPTGLTTLLNANMYQSYKVFNSTIGLKFSSTTSSNNMLCTIVPSTSSSLTTDIYVQRTQPLARNGCFNASKPDEGCNQQGYLVNSRTVAQVLGLSQLQFDADDSLLVAGVGGGPASTIYWYIFFQAIDQDVSSATKSILQVRVSYDVELWNLTGAEMKQT
jgi:hypothetical protein